jgi:hypothetical protein
MIPAIIIHAITSHRSRLERPTDLPGRRHVKLD